MKFLAYFFKFLFRFKPLTKYYFSLYKRVFKPYRLFRDVKIQTTYDRHFRIEVEVGEWIQQQIFFFGIYDEPSINFIKNHLKPDSVFIDIGANIGAYSLSASSAVKKEEGGIVYSFEPVSHVYEKLRQNIELNRVETIVPNKLALFEENTTIDLFIANNENLGMSSIFHHDSESGEVEQVEAIKLDDFIKSNQIKKVDLIKIDIEGAELFALKGMVKTMKRFKPVFLIEISESVLGGNEIQGIEIFNFMERLNYLPYTIEAAGNILPFKSALDKKITNFVFVYSNG